MFRVIDKSQGRIAESVHVEDRSRRWDAEGSGGRGGEFEWRRFMIWEKNCEEREGILVPVGACGWGMGDGNVAWESERGDDDNVHEDRMDHTVWF